MKHTTTKTKKGMYLLNSYKSWTARHVEELYKNPSTAKIAAETELRMWYMDDPYATDFRCGNAGTFQFSCAWITAIDGVIPALIYHTRDNVYCVYLE